MLKQKLESLLVLITSVVSLLSGLVTIFDSLNYLYYTLAMIILTSLTIIYYAIKINKSDINFKLLNENIEILFKDEFGEVAEYKNKRTLKAIKNNVQLFYTTLNPFDGYIQNIRISTGIIESIDIRNNISFIATRFQSMLKKNQIVEQELKCEFIGSFKSDKEYWVLNKNYFNETTSIKITFPINRPPKTFSSVKKKGHFENIMDEQPELSVNNNGTTTLYLKITNAELYTDYLIKWDW